MSNLQIRTKAERQAAFGHALAKAKRMSLAEARAVYGGNFETYKTVKEMRLEGWGIKVGYELTMRSCGFKHQSFYYEFLHYPKGVK